MKRFALVMAIAFFMGCSSLPVVVPPIDDIINVPIITNDTNTIVIAIDKAAPELGVTSWKEKSVYEMLNTNEGYAGLGFLVIAVILTGVLIYFNKRNSRTYRR